MKRLNFATRTSVSVAALSMALGGAAVGQEAQPEAEDGEFLGTITLGESKREVATDTANPVTTIDRAEIRDRQATTIAELIDSVPGVTLVNGSTPSGSGINIRGFGATDIFGTDQKVAVLVDGATTGSEELYRIGTQLFTDPYLFRSVEVQRGTVGSFEYGSGIIGGVVRLETIDASDLTGGEVGFKWAQTLGFYSNQDGFNTSTTLAWQPTENLEFLANYSYREQSGQEDGAGDPIGNSAFELPSFLLKGRLSFGEDNAHALEASYTETEASDRDVPYDTFITTTDAFGNVDRDTVSQTAALTYTYAPGSDLIDLEVALTYSNQEIDQNYVPGSSSLENTPSFPFLIGTVNADHQYETTKFTLKNESFLETGSLTHEIRYGFEWLEKERLEASAAPGGTDERTAFFVVNNITIVDGLTFTPALRFEDQKLSGEFFDAIVNARTPGTRENDALLGGASLRYEFDSGFALFASYAYTESFPILDDIPTSMFSNASRIDTPEVANTYEAGFSFDRTGLFSEFDILAFKLNYFDTTLEDITSYPGTLEVEIAGYEIEASYATRGGFYVDLNANFVEGEELQSGGVIDWDRTPQDSVRVTLGQRLGELFGSIDTDLSAEIIHISESDLNVNTSGDGDEATLLNLRATLEPTTGFLEGTQFRVSIENAGNERYQPALATRNAVGANFKLSVSRVFF